MLHPHRRTFSRSYGAILPSSFTRVLSSALVFSTQPPVSVWGTVPGYLKLRSFSWKHGINHFVTQRVTRHQLSALKSRIYLRFQPTTLNLDNQRQAGLAFRRGCFSHPLSLLMSAFALLIPPASFSTHLHRLTERSSTASPK